MISRRQFLLLSGGAALATGCRESSAVAFPIARRSAVTSWSTDPFALGSYSFLKVGSTPADRVALAAPVSDRIFFAGEATDSDFPATVHGAILSGRRAAEEAMEEVDGTIVVVGAGAAGLAAAAALVDEDYDVIVFEGRDRVGGRVRTDTRSVGVPVDLGASWIHGITDNPVTEYASDFGVRTRAFDYDDAVSYDASGTELEVDHSEDLVDELFEELDFRAGESLQAAVDRSPYRSDPLIDYAFASWVEYELAADADEIDPAAWDEGEELDGGDQLVVGGYQRIAEGMASDFDVTLRATVDEIALVRGGVEVVVGGTRHAASAVIVTVPLGVLKAGRPRFTPALPAAKRAAISRLGMGALSKAVLRFDTQFWDDVAVIDIAGRVPRGAWTEFVNLEPFTGKPILMGFCAGRSARYMEALRPEAAVASATAALRDVYGT